MKLPRHFFKPLAVGAPAPYARTARCGWSA